MDSEAVQLALSHEGGLRQDGMELKPSQIRNADRALSEHAIGRHGIVIADLMGSGKTLSAIVIMAAARAATGLRRCVVVCPRPTKQQWLDALARHTRWLRVAACADAEADCVVLTMRELIALDACATSACFGRPYAALVIDESHYFKNRKTQRHAAAMVASANAAFPVLLTGTPVQNHDADLDAQFMIARARARASSDADSVAEMHETSLMRTADLSNFPPLERVYTELDMPPDEDAAFTRSLQACRKTVDDFMYARIMGGEQVKYANIMAQLMALRKCSVAHAMVGAERRADAVDAVVRAPSKKLLSAMESARRYVSERRKVVIFCFFVEPLFALRKLFNGEAEMYYGELSDAKRASVLHRFATDASLNILLVSTACGGVGLNLQVASAAIILDLWWNPFVTHQAISRIWRCNQTRECVVEFVQYRNSFDTAVAALYHSPKERLAADILREKTPSAFGADEAVNLVTYLCERRNIGSQRTAPRTPDLGGARADSSAPETPELLKKRLSREMNSEISAFFKRLKYAVHDRPKTAAAPAAEPCGDPETSNDPDSFDNW